MLSYQHIYHAGNLADVQKHALLAWILEYMTRKDKPLSYLETHAGRALYDLSSAEAVKTGEAARGIDIARDWFPADHPYARVLDSVQAAHGPTSYPGSPRIATEVLRPIDNVHLAELHPQEAQALRASMRGSGAKVHVQDGFEMAQSLAPPEPRRGVLLIDPSYEIKSDYSRIPGIIGKLHRKWNVGVIVLWYPILTDGPHKRMLTALEAQGLPGTLLHEVRFPPAREGHRMIGSGLFVVNAPFGLREETQRLDRRFSALR
ncbi:23S rRNA (adenine(2030)-N(6))-methyltransferase RlmJ [Tritonibacter scottomollicae]|uniref:Ribosomal RNA large subunit methyltransferase J n=1 Tax=Tritonibacter scottomollicae TaxID=483013 RepID=A0A2T1AGR0_TRISK|nr:23S rRNA (adenine(2030)-N(6))-methyltransferase RlmJ [Tritonibacter scottomollicae]PRZ47508.1 23S rRNA (adenine2030-N6)-methyltransferase [Tritonibacter scottomollicae]